VIDEADRELAPEIALLGTRVLVTATVMGGEDDRQRLGREVLDFAGSLAAERMAAR
jgi:hypothetical protein